MKTRSFKNGENIYPVLRLREKLSASETARRCGLPNTSYVGAEKGNDVKLEIVMRIAAYYGVSLHSLICGNVACAVAELGRMQPFDPDAMALRKGDSHLPEGKLCGLRYWRKKRCLSIRALSESASVAAMTIGSCERLGFSLCTHSSVLRRLAAALNVSVDELLTLRDESELQPGDRSSVPAKSRRGTNVLDNFRVSRNLTYRSMAGLLGISHQAVFCNCIRTPVQMKYVRRLCELEGLSTPEFLEKYKSSKVSRSFSA